MSYSARIRHQKGSKSKNWFWSHKLWLWLQYWIFWYFDVAMLLSLSTVSDESFISATYLFRKVNVRLFKKKKIVLLCFDESSLKLKKNTFYYILKAIFILKIFIVLSHLFGQKINTNIRLISKFMTSQPG